MESRQVRDSLGQGDGSGVHRLKVLSFCGSR